MGIDAHLLDRVVRYNKKGQQHARFAGKWRSRSELATAAMQHGPRGGARGQMGPRMPFPRGHPPMEDPAREKAIRSIFGNWG